MPYVFPESSPFNSQGLQKVDPEIYKTLLIIRQTRQDEADAAAAAQGRAPGISEADKARDWNAGIDTLRVRAPEQAVILASAGKQSRSAAIRDHAKAALDKMAQHSSVNPGKIGNASLGHLPRPASGQRQAIP